MKKKQVVTIEVNVDLQKLGSKLSDALSEAMNEMFDDYGAEFDALFQALTSVAEDLVGTEAVRKRIADAIAKELTRV